MKKGFGKRPNLFIEFPRKNLPSINPKLLYLTYAHQNIINKSLPATTLTGNFDNYNINNDDDNNNNIL